MSSVSMTQDISWLAQAVKLTFRTVCWPPHDRTDILAVCLVAGLDYRVISVDLSVVILSTTLLSVPTALPDIKQRSDLLMTITRVALSPSSQQADKSQGDKINQERASPL
ncbi:hypothetical protein BaRGS_00010054 [Batillaria attramentaria]|uniref:Uncharacterized protein n=1 Tax=Batillaria attramentaria TaxID=370345 RepID=A0ABD0LGN0_9CAEN